MKMIEVFHGSNTVVQHPLCRIGRPFLDFGQGFYVTDMQEQAIEWAKNVARREGGSPLLNSYLLDRESVLAESRNKVFTAYDREWLLFIVNARSGVEIAQSFDYVEGGVANDRVVDTVNLYIAGLMDIETALQRLAQLQPNNQICLLNQGLIDKYLIYDGTTKI